MLAFVVVSSNSIGCYTRITHDKNWGTYDGIFVSGFEISSFKPCGSKENWWVTGNDEVFNKLFKGLENLRGQGYRQAYVRFRGNVSEKGMYGHLNGYDREFTLRDVVFVRNEKPDECK